jgi:ubiquinone/menaquinone biosynthesis C-methylase UbiE
MNAAERLFCSSSLWRYLTAHKVLPWILSGVQLGDHLLEIGAGYGAATPQLARHVSRVTSLEYDYQSLRKLKSQISSAASPVCGDASVLPFAPQVFSAALAVLVLHHLKSPQLQDRVFAEVFRVLRPGAIFLAFEIPDSWLHHIGHIGSTFTPLAPDSVSPRLISAGFINIAVDARASAFRFAAIRPS